ncbi:MAG: glycine zipper domain-containing protein, partial [Planctomycetota bacterium JB042]
RAYRSRWNPVSAFGVRPMSYRLLPLALIVSALTLPACRTATQTGALTGGAVGAGAGALVASAIGESTGGGALIGAGVGGLLGGLTGHAIDHRPRGGVLWDGPGAYAPRPVAVAPAPVATVARPVRVHAPPPCPAYPIGTWHWTGTGWIWLDG